MTPAELAESNDSNSLLTTDTYQTDETESSATTVWGPGTLSGKAIKSLGEASLRGLDHLIIRWKLARINSDLAKSNASTGTSSFSDEKLERIWDDLLELSRLDFYDAKVRQKALRLIMIQIGSRETSHLVSCIMKWPPEEIRIFLSEMMEFMPILWKRENRETSQVLSYPELILVYRASQSTTERHEIIPFLDFVSQVAQKRSFIRQAVLAAGYLTLLTDIHRHYNVESALEAIIAAREALVVFLDNPEPLEHHRMDLVWPRATSNIPMTRKSLELATLTPNKRKLAWMSAERARIRERLCEIQVILEMPIYHHEGCQADLFDLCFDLVVLHHLEEIDRTLAEVAFSHLVRCVAVGGALGEALRYVLAHSSYEVILGMFYRITYPLLQMGTEPFPIAEHLCRQIIIYHPDRDPIDYIVEFAADVADASYCCAQAIVDADVKSLLGNTTANINRGDLLQRFQNAAAASEDSLPARLDLSKKFKAAANRRRSVTI